MPKPQRVSIIGDSSSGKTHTAQILSQKLNLPIYDLEDIDWEIKFSKKRNSAERDNLLKQLSIKKSGIFLGVPSGWNNQFLLNAQTIIALDVPSHIRAYRLARRYVQRKINKRATESPYKLIRNIGHALIRPSPTREFLSTQKHQRNIFVFKKASQERLFELLNEN